MMVTGHRIRDSRSDGSGNCYWPRIRSHRRHSSCEGHSRTFDRRQRTRPVCCNRHLRRCRTYIPTACSMTNRPVRHRRQLRGPSRSTLLLRTQASTSSQPSEQSASHALPDKTAASPTDSRDHGRPVTPSPHASPSSDSTRLVKPGHTSQRLAWTRHPQSNHSLRPRWSKTE